MKRIILYVLIVSSFLSAQMSSSSSSKFQSLILPGLGELEMGHEKRARSFFIREAALWLVCIGGTKAANWHESDYRAFAEIHANVDMNDKDYLFSVNLGHYDSFSEYNAINTRKRLTGDLYEEGGDQWQWDSTQNRIKYDRMRIKSVTYKKYSQFAIGGLVLHRLISLIDVIYLERQHPNVSLLPDLSTNSATLELKFLF